MSAVRVSSVSSAPSLSAIFKFLKGEQSPHSRLTARNWSLLARFRARNSHRNDETQLKIMGERDCVAPLAVGRVKIIGAAPDRPKSRPAIHFHRRIALADFEVNASHSLLARLVHEMVEE